VGEANVVLQDLTLCSIVAEDVKKPDKASLSGFLPGLAAGKGLHSLLATARSGQAHQADAKQRKGTGFGDLLLNFLNLDVDEGGRERLRS
jgi:hypothetical protein